MPGTSDSILRPAARRQDKPLSPEEFARAEQIARRLQEELRVLLDLLPEHARGASSLSRYFSLDRATCQRIVSAVSERMPTPPLLVKLPGVRGLKQFIAAFREHPGTAEESVLAGAEAAVEQFQRLLTEVGGSQSKLASRLTASTAARPAASSEPPGVRGLREREALFRTASAVSRRTVDLSLAVYVILPAKDNPKRVETVSVTGMIGQVAAPDAVPLSFMFGSATGTDEQPTPWRYAALDNTPAVGRSPRSILAPFSSDPLPLVTSRGPRGMLLQIVDPKAAAGKPLDVVIAARNSAGVPHPRYDNPPIHECWSVQQHPCRRLIMDVWMHRDLARTCIPVADAHLIDPNFEVFFGHRWHSRFPSQPHGPRLEMLGTGLGNAAHEAYQRHAELAAFTFEQIGWDPEEFVGHRVDVQYPIWRAGYCMWFDFSGTGPETADRE